MKNITILLIALIFLVTTAAFIFKHFRKDYRDNISLCFSSMGLTKDELVTNSSFKAIDFEVPINPSTSESNNEIGTLQIGILSTCVISIEDNIVVNADYFLKFEGQQIFDSFFKNTIG